MRRYFTPILAATMILFISCSKDTSNQNHSLNGTWNLKSSSVQLRSAVIDFYNGDNLTTDTVFNYTTQNNNGNITITDDSIYTTGLSYTVSDTIHIHHYTNSVDTYPQESPVSFTVIYPQLNMQFKMIGTDSIYFPQGATLSLPDNLGIPQPVVFNGAKIVLSGNTLTMTSVLSEAFVYPYDTGIPDTPMYHLDAVVKTIFQK